MGSLKNLTLGLTLCALANSAWSVTVCIKGKNGVQETWEVSEADAALIKVSEKCDEKKAVAQSSNPANESITLPQLARASDRLEVAEITVPAFNQTVSPPVASNSEAVVTPIVKAESKTWVTSQSDGNMRLLLKRWSQENSWKLLWHVDRDIPLDSDDAITTDFKSAVRRVLGATALSDVQLKPCFYSNMVLRVVRETVKCNPNE